MKYEDLNLHLNLLSLGTPMECSKSRLMNARAKESVSPVKQLRSSRSFKPELTDYELTLKRANYKSRHFTKYLAEKRYHKVNELIERLPVDIYIKIKECS